ncbi:PilZ domain-containing protein [Photobacterium kagoshimensis]|uniref:PilZ domain-containing protein n=1 Tax=Photobacterium kagoshimensis TaxID=2910242 RepID=UPI003D099E3E
MVERRHFKRIMYQAPATLHQADGSWQTDVRDLSLQGILITRPQEWHPSKDDTYTITFCLHECDIELSMETQLVDNCEDYLRMNIHHIDIDSASHLKRLVELNVGTDELLHRELEHLTDLPNT